MAERVPSDTGSPPLGQVGHKIPSSEPAVDFTSVPELLSVDYSDCAPYEVLRQALVRLDHHGTPFESVVE